MRADDVDDAQIWLLPGEEILWSGRAARVRPSAAAAKPRIWPRPARFDLYFRSIGLIVVAPVIVGLIADRLVQDGPSEHGWVYLALCTLWAALGLNAVLRTPGSSPRFLWRAMRPAHYLITDMRAVVLFGRGPSRYELGLFLDQIPAKLLLPPHLGFTDDAGSASTQSAGDPVRLLVLTRLQSLFQEETVRSIALTARDRLLSGGFPASAEDTAHAERPARSTGRWTSERNRRIRGLILSRGERDTSVYLVFTYFSFETGEWHGAVNLGFIIALAVVGMLRQVSGIGKARAELTLSYRLTSKGLAVVDDPRGPDPRVPLDGMTPPGRLGSRAPLRLMPAPGRTGYVVELAGLADPEEAHRRILTAELATRMSPANLPTT